jgi:heavy metal translocating P-type ATPase
MNRGKLDPALLVISLGALAAGLIAAALDVPDIARWSWIATSLLLTMVIGIEMIARLAKRQVGVDLIALLSMVGALYFSEFLVAAVIAVMLASGRTLEHFTAQRAERELKRLIQRAPTCAWQIEGEQLVSTALDQISPGAQILVRMGDVIPLDGTLINSGASIDESALTGEPIPVDYGCGAHIRSGSVNVGAAFALRVTHSASDSTYAGIVKMAENARRSRAPFVRAADRYALILIPVTLIIAGSAWFFSQDPLRALAVLVVSTPCPLILAVPIALLSGISRCARQGILVKDGATLEALANTRIVMLDKTGTLTTGHASINSVETRGDIDRDRLLLLAGSIAQGSRHPVSMAITAAARQSGAALLMPLALTEQPGAGLSGRIDGQQIRLGSLAFVCADEDAWSKALLARVEYQGVGTSFIAVSGKVAGAILFSDPVRYESAFAVRAIKRAGVKKVTLLTGDRLATAQWAALAAGVDEVLAGLTPQDKVNAVQQACTEAMTMMVGDGINDAPALAAANVGVALGASGASAASEAAGVVLLVDRFDRVAHALHIAQRACAIARQCVFIGMGLSVLAMLVAAAGYLPPLTGAVLQELIDVSVILNALRALGSPGWRPVRGLHNELVQRLDADHLKMARVLETLNRLARDFAHLSPQVARSELRTLVNLLDKQLLPHELDDENRLYPLLLANLRGNDPFAALSHTHREIFRLARVLGHLNAGLLTDPKAPEREEIHTTLIRLDTLLTLHFAQENELYRSLRV